MAANFLDTIIGKRTSTDLQATRDDMMIRAQGSTLGHTTLRARIFSNTDEAMAAEGKQLELEAAAVAYMDSLEKLALVHYIRATSNTEVAAVEQEAENSLRLAMGEWLKHCNPHLVTPDAKERAWLMAPAHLSLMVESISQAMCNHLREHGMDAGDDDRSKPVPRLG